MFVRMLLLLMLGVGLAVMTSAAHAQQTDHAKPQAKAKAAAMHWLDRAGKQAQAIPSKADRAEVQAVMAGVAGQCGQTEAYRRHVGKALALSFSQSARVRGAVAWSLAQSHARAGRVTKALVTAGAAGGDYFVISANAAVAGVLHRRGQERAADQAINAAMNAYRRASRPTKQAALFALSRTLALTGQFDELDSLLKRAKTRDEVGHPYTVEGLANCSAIAARAGANKQARSLLKRAGDQAQSDLGNLDQAQAQVQGDSHWPAAVAALVDALAVNGKLEKAKRLSRWPDDWVKDEAAHVSSSAAFADLALARHAADTGRPRDAAAAWEQVRQQVTAIEDAYTRAWLWHELLIEAAPHGLVDSKNLDAWVNALPTPLERTLAAVALAEVHLKDR